MEVAGLLNYFINFVNLALRPLVVGLVKPVVLLLVLVLDHLNLKRELVQARERVGVAEGLFFCYF